MPVNKCSPGSDLEQQELETQLKYVARGTWLRKVWHIKRWAIIQHLK